ncbi:MAG: acyl-CoA dehydrogenase [Actinobacteria bacterium]|nr:MAG: acyl-CoA dehydrogenase [Actinomycetota bacterium]
MDVRLNDEHLLVQETAARLAADHALLIAPSVAGAEVDDDDAWMALRDTGFLALHAPETLGGAGATALDVALVAEQLGSRLCTVAFVAQAVLAPELLVLAGLGDLVSYIAAGSLRLTVALDPTLRTIARAGEPCVAWDAAHATHALLFDESNRLCRCEVVGDELPALDRTRVVRAIDVAGSARAVPLSAIALTDEQRARFDALAYTSIAADLVGVMQGSLDSAVRYVRDRVQFGAAVGSFQAVQHLAADAAVLVEGSRSSLWHAAWAVDARSPIDALLAARQAKAYCSRAARQVVEISVQLHGGIAITWEHLAHVRVRRALFMAASFGDERAQLQAIADHRLGAEPARAGH